MAGAYFTFFSLCLLRRLSIIIVGIPSRLVITISFLVGTGVGGSTASAQSEYVPDDSTDNAEANEQNGNYDDE